MDLSSLTDQLTDANRPIRLRMWKRSGEYAHGLLVMHVSGSETMCGGLDYALLCVATAAGQPLKA
ncbi:hypothetical protein FPK48_26130, partial [Acinetobacter baumannii]|nr:hypothetical protein [Acinetobacter baumannii]